MRKLRSLHPLTTLFYWEFWNDFLRVISITGIIGFVAILGAILGITYWGALGLRAFLEERGLIDVVGALYYVVGFPLLAITGLLIGASILTLSVLQEEERDMWLRSLLTHRDFGFYAGARSLLAAFCLTFLAGFLFLFLGKVVWRIGLLDFLSGGVVILLLGVFFCTLGTLLMGLLVMSIPPRHQKRVLVGLAGFIAILLVGSAVFVDIEILLARLLDILINPYLPTAWGMELFFFIEAKGWFAQESLMRLLWLIGLTLAGGVALYWVLPLVYRLEKGPKEGYDLATSLPVGWDTRFATLLGRLPLERSTRAFLKRDLIIALRHPGLLITGIIMIGITFAVSIGDEMAAVPLFMVYFIPIEFASAYMGASLRTEGSNLDYIKMLLERGNFLVGKIAATLLLVFFVSAVILFICIALSPALEWDFVAVGIRILILVMAVFGATLLAMTFGEKILISGKGGSLDQTVTRWFLGWLMAAGWLLVDFYFTKPQMIDKAPAWLLALLPHLPLIIFGGIISYCILRLRNFARAIEEI
ncbi:MAG: hypothetical protein DDT30_01782 [Dehalococcoidia bacterium]|nr:hypothetical protein [Bacillota bacterium]MBT9166334.1 hypothetical protein [Chloroflexota bacterium]